jgi:acetate kinase
MMSGDVLALNCGSSSLKYSVFLGDSSLASGSVDGIGSDGRAADHGDAVHEVLDQIERPSAVGHRLVHGGPDHLVPSRVDAALVASLRRAIPFAPLHLPAEILAIEAVTRRFGDLPQVACFDTSFHRNLPEVARRFALPSKLTDSGIHRYGFHGLSYEYVVESLGVATLGRAVIAHLGSGASLCALRDGRSVDTTMGFTPSGGIVMGSRCGDIDPGVLVYLLAQRGYDARTLEHLVNHESGLLGVSGTTADMQKLLAARDTDTRAALAIDVFCYHARKSIGALAAVLGGVETIVFTGGIGARAPAIRRVICEGLGFLGVEIDDERNAANDSVIGRGACAIRTITTDEERMIARHTRRVLASSGPAS